MHYIFTILLDILIQEKQDSSRYSIAKYLINHVNEVQSLSTESLAKACHVSKATISRFCRTIGLEDFMELKMLLRAYYPDIDKKFYFERKSSDYIDDYLECIEDKISVFKESLDKEILHALVDDIHTYNKVNLMGHMQSANITFTLQQDLRPLNKFVECFHEMTQQKEALLHANSDTLIIVFSATGSFFNSTLKRERFMQHNQSKIYMITTSLVRKPAYIDTVIQLDQDYNYATSTVLMQIYANLIAIGYKESFVSQNETA